MKKIKLFTAVLLLAGFGLSAEVFWPGPGRGSRAASGGLPNAAFRDLLEQTSLLNEPALYNGIRTEIRVSLLQQSLESVLAELRSRYPGLKIRISHAGVIFSIRTGKKYRERVLLIGNDGRVTAFAMELPEPLPKCPEWPAELPLPNGAEPEEIVRLTRRGTWYGAFRNAAPHALAGTAAQVSGMGFAPVTGEAARSGGTGELFTNAATGELMTVTIAADGTGTVIRTKTANDFHLR